MNQRNIYKKLTITSFPFWKPPKDWISSILHRERSLKNFSSIHRVGLRQKTSWSSKRLEMDKHLVIIPNTISPYGYETVPVLATPTGFQYRFRFDEEWVQNSIVHRSDLNGKEGYIVLREFKTGRLLPIRYFRVVSFNKIGKIYYIEVTLGELVPYDSDENHRQKQIVSFNTKFSEFNSSIFKTNSPGDKMAPLVFLTNFSLQINNEHRSSDLDEQLEGWGNILTCFKDIDFFTDVQFLRLIDAEPVDSNVGKASFRDGQLILLERADYKIQLAQFITKISRSDIPQTDIKISGDNRTISVLRGVQRAVGKYDVLTFIIRVNKYGGSGATFLDLQYQPKPTDNKIGEPHLFIPVKILKSPQKLFKKIGLLTLFSLLYIGPNFPALLSNWTWLANKASFLQDISIVGFTLSLWSVLEELKWRRD